MAERVFTLAKSVFLFNIFREDPLDLCNMYKMRETTRTTTAKLLP